MIQLVPVSSVLSAMSGVRPPASIDTADDTQTDYWASRLNITRDELFDAIGKVGPSVAAVRRHLGK